jgi:cytochrome bd-type quinol oxidase subunit 2
VPETDARPTNQGPGRVLIAVYILFVIAASSRAGYQIATRFDEAPVAYLLSALAAVIYILATVGLARGGSAGRRTALVCCTVELVGVLVVGFLSLFDRELFPDDTVWSGFGQGYGYIPLVLPVLGLLWLRRTRDPRPVPDPAS